ncbi:hypothetical protein [Micromonospora sp. WMMD710]|uniref:hypothetical protein n=1 Tax=Micromonospora sp. WMMD710 TaxID=3016085 RepID=UPI002415F5B2|nr:hypothetical protein [Micromonospora sp. WMMD710]MDG4760484.1 hypothetical protein [Micromonospora sp. WMMD710]
MEVAVTRTWICDSCGDGITDPGMALVVWRSGPEYRDFLIVHKSVGGRDCDPEAGAGYTGNLELKFFLGLEGLTRLLGWLSAGPIRNVPDSNRVSDMDGFVDLVRRVQIPWYEQARSRFRDEQTHHWLGDANEYYPYQPDVLQRIAQERLGHR